MTTTLSQPKAARVHNGAPRPFTPRTPAGSMYTLHAFVAPNRVWRGFASLLRRIPLSYRLFTAGEATVKSTIFGCTMCGQCALPETAYACPQTCPKQLRNGPCGGVSIDGHCEVYPEKRCIWVIAYERAAESGHGSDLHQIMRPIDHRRWGTSAWVSYWSGEDDLVIPVEAIERRPMAVAAGRNGSAAHG